MSCGHKQCEGSLSFKKKKIKKEKPTTRTHTRTHARTHALTCYSMAQHCSYDIISIGQAVDIDDYTQAARTVLGNDPSAGGGADLMGQGTWRWNSPRSEWAVWSVPMVGTVGISLIHSRASLIR